MHICSNINHACRAPKQSFIYSKYSIWLPKSVNRFSERFDIQSSSLNATEVYFLLLQGNAWMRGHSWQDASGFELEVPDFRIN